MYQLNCWLIQETKFFEVNIELPMLKLAPFYTWFQLNKLINTYKRNACLLNNWWPTLYFAYIATYCLTNLNSILFLITCRWTKHVFKSNFNYYSGDFTVFTLTNAVLTLITHHREILCCLKQCQFPAFQDVDMTKVLKNLFPIIQLR